MPRIVYYGFPTGRIQGGMKMILRHVETLRDLGFDAVFATSPEAVMPEWLDHRAPVHRAFPVQRGDVLVIPEDAANALGQAMRRDPARTVELLSALDVPELEPHLGLLRGQPDAVPRLLQADDLGVPLAALFQDVLLRVQEEVGFRWQQGERLSWGEMAYIREGCAVR